MAHIALFGKHSFGAAAAQALARAGHRVDFIVSPSEHDRGHPDPLRRWADDTWTNWQHADRFTHTDLPDGIDLIVAAHSHRVIGAKTRARVAAAIGYHPSLLPIHRGRDAVRWTIHQRDRITGGSVYHLTNGIDAGPLAAQRTVLVRPDDTTSSLWARLFTVGVELLVQAADDHDAGRLAYVPQDEACATWEPSWERPRLYRPELTPLPARPERDTRQDAVRAGIAA